MNHLDEGTIHAWLDGALDATQAGEAEAHVAGCAPCAAAVAEARGFIAGTSRILNALDDVPAGVIPKRPAAAPAAPAARPRRQWRAAPWVTGIAAVLVAAVALQTSMRSSRSFDGSPLAESAARVVNTDAVSAPTLPPAVVSATKEQAQAAADRGEAAPVTSTAETRTAVRPPVAVARGDVRPPAPEAPRQTMERRAVVGGVAGGVAAPAAPPTEQAIDEASVRKQRVPAANQASDMRALASIQATDADASGCYRIERAPLMALGATIAPAATADARRSAGRAAAPAPTAAAPSARAEFSAKAEGATLVRLDTTASRLGLTVRAVLSDSIVGSWTARGDSVQVRLDARAPQMLAKASRIECPRP